MNLYQIKCKGFCQHGEADVNLKILKSLRTNIFSPDREPRMILEEQNSRPRKRLGNKTPNVVFMESLSGVVRRV